MQLSPLSTLEPSEQAAGVAAFEMPLGAEHGLGEQENVDGIKAPKSQLKDEVLSV